MKTIYLPGLAGLLLLASCGLHRTTYIAPLPNTPMFTQEAEAYCNVGASPTHVDAQGGISLTKHVGITASRFYSGSIRNSNELGINLFTKGNGNLFVGSTFGWGDTKIGHYYTNPFNSAEHSELHVAYHSLFVQPSIYYAKPTDNGGKIRFGLSFKYAANQLTQYFYNEYKNEWHSSYLNEENIYTAGKQRFKALTPLFSAEYNWNNLSLGGHVGYTETTSINAHYKRIDYINRRITEYDLKRSLYYFPLIIDFYIGLRL